MAQHFLLSRPAKTLTLAQVFRMTERGSRGGFRQGPLARRRTARRSARMRRLERLRLPAPERRAALPLPRVQGRFLDYQRNAVCLAQAAAARLSRGHRDLLQRGERQVRAGPLARSWRRPTRRLRPLPQAPRGDGGGNEGPRCRRRRQSRRSRRRLFRRLCEARNLAENRVDRRFRATKTASARSSSSFASATAIRFRPCSARKAKPIHGSRRASPRERSSTPTKRPHGMACTARSK